MVENSNVDLDTLSVLHELEDVIEQRDTVPEQYAPVIVTGNQLDSEVARALASDNGLAKDLVYLAGFGVNKICAAYGISEDYVKERLKDPEFVKLMAHHNAIFIASPEEARRERAAMLVDAALPKMFDIVTDTEKPSDAVKAFAMLMQAAGLNNNNKSTDNNLPNGATMVNQITNVHCGNSVLSNRYKPAVDVEVTDAKVSGS